MLDAMDVMLYSLVLAYLIREFAMDTRVAGLLNSLTLVASAIGGLLFGVIADRIGRTRSLMASILVYSLASAACGLSHSIGQLARSEEHTSELQSPCNLVCRLLLEKKNNSPAR